MEKLVKAQNRWIEIVREAWLEVDYVEEDDHIELPKEKWEALSKAITSPVRINHG